MLIFQYAECGARVNDISQMEHVRDEGDALSQFHMPLHEPFDQLIQHGYRRRCKNRIHSFPPVPSLYHGPPVSLMQKAPLPGRFYFLSYQPPCATKTSTGRTPKS